MPAGIFQQRFRFDELHRRTRRLLRIGQRKHDRVPVRPRYFQRDDRCDLLHARAARQFRKRHRRDIRNAMSGRKF